jgi:pimeloyl-ACP methyl ester carboxylesterase
VVEPNHRSTTTPATVVLVSPPCATTAAWDRVVPLLDDHDVPNIAVQLPSCLPESDVDDATLLRSVLDDCGRAVVLVAHSGGGAVITEVGTHPAVKHLVYVDAAMWDVGEDWFSRLRGAVDEDFSACLRFREDVTEFDTDALTAYFLGAGWSPDDTRTFVAGFRPQRHSAFTSTLTEAAWRTVPSTFISPADSENKRQLRDHFASRAMHVIEIEGDHFPHWHRPDEIAGILTRIARSPDAE